MISVSVTELFILTLTFFVAILGTLSALALLRVLKILKIANDITDYYWQIKQTVENIVDIPSHMFERFFGSSKNDEASDK